jgi:NADPH-dependent 2,4-dienoyl-CoA reductase/sulfur reductase-like enzyme
MPGRLRGALCALPAAIAKRVRGDAVTHPIADDGRFPSGGRWRDYCPGGAGAGDGMRLAIAGAGPIGLSIAIALPRPGHQVAVIDSDGCWAYRRLRRDPARKERRT